MATLMWRVISKRPQKTFFRCFRQFISPGTLDSGSVYSSCVFSNKLKKDSLSYWHHICSRQFSKGQVFITATNCCIQSKSEGRCSSTSRTGKNHESLPFNINKNHGLLRMPYFTSFHGSSAKLHMTPPFKVSEICVISQENDFLELSVAGQPLILPYIWLRDHCRSEHFYNHSTNQKNVDFKLLQRDLTPKSVQTLEGTLYITWQDEHRSEFPLSWILDNFYPAQFSCKVKQHFWTSKTLTDLPTVSHDDHMTTNTGLQQTLTNLVKYGFTVVEGSPVSIEGTQAVVERITFVKETLFGKMWSFTADGSRSDTAYTTIALGPHTDNTYFDHPSGLQVFHCLEHTGGGGETLLVDGFQAVHQLISKDRAAFDVLSTTRIPHEYVEPAGPQSCGYHLYSLGTVITAHPTSNEILQLRFNPYDRAPLNTIEPKAIPEFYRAYDSLSQIIKQSDNHLWVKLKPGMVLLIDNWRVMHGRAAFDGKRIICGCYVGREEWVSQARIYGIL